MTEPKISDRTLLYGLIIECPFGESKDCPLDKYRFKEIEKRIKWVKSLSDQEVYEFVDYHKVCFLKRENE